MKRILGLFAGLALLVGGAAAVFGQASSSNYMSPGGAYWGVGGVIDIVTGGSLKFGGTAYKPARGATLITANPTAVTTGLSTIVACSTTIRSSLGPTTQVVTYTASSGTLNLYGWKPTDSTTTTLVASPTETVGWLCWGS